MVNITILESHSQKGIIDELVNFMHKHTVTSYSYSSTSNNGVSTYSVMVSYND